MGTIPGEPKESPKPQPIGNMTLIFLFTSCTLCCLFIMWRRANSFRMVVSHKLRNLGRSEGLIRLSEDDGPPATEFIADVSDDDDEQLNDSQGEYLAQPDGPARESNGQGLLPPAKPT